MDYIASNGALFTDEDIIRWAAEAEAGFPNTSLDPVEGRPWETALEPMQTKTIRAPRELWNLVKLKADQAGQTQSQWLRDAITAKLTG